MTGTASSRLAVLLAALAIGLSLTGLLLLVLTLDHPPRGGWGFRGFPAIFVLGASTIGWLLMTRRPDNRIGLVLASIGVLNGAQLFLTEYAALAARTGLPAGTLAGWVNAFIWVPTLTLMAGAVPLLFPDGHLPSPRWRPIGWVLAGGAAALIAIIAAYPDAVGTPRFVQPVIRIPIPDATLDELSYGALLILAVGIVASGVSLLLRWRHSSGAVREQLKWLALSVALVAVTMPLSVIRSPWAVAVFIFAIGSVPVAVGIAVLRYRLYEIDAVISRTLVFGLLTALLAGLFAGLQRLLQAIFLGVTGSGSDAAIVITTLILAAGFAPMKSGLERLVARRFGAARGPAAEATVADVAPAVEGVLAVELEPLLRRVVREELDAVMASRNTKRS